METHANQIFFRFVSLQSAKKFEAKLAHHTLEVQACKGLPPVLHSHVQNFYRTPAGYTADRKTRRKRNMVCYMLLSAACHLSSSSPPPHRASVAPPTATLSGLAGGGRPPPPHTPNRIIARSWQPRPKSRTASI
jgi:hypothetical protein